MWQAGRAKTQMYRASIKTNDTGYTLLELLVVVAIVGILATGAPTVYARVVPQFEVRQYANSLATQIRSLRDKARREGETTYLSYSDESEVITGNADSIPTPGNVKVKFKPVGPWQSDGLERVAFYASGSTTGGLFTISRDAISIDLLIDWVSGSVEIFQ